MPTSSTEADQVAMPIDDEVRLYFSPGAPGRAALDQNPYPFYERMRAAARVYNFKGVWFAMGFREADELVRNPVWRRTLASSQPHEAPHAERSAADRIFLDKFSVLDEPDHSRLRRSISPAFTARATERRRARTPEIVRELLDGLRERDEFDFINDFASAVPTAVIGEMLGLPSDRHGDLIRWSRHREGTAPLARLFDSGAAGASGQSEEELAALDQAAIECEEFFQSQIEYRRHSPGDDLISAMLAGSESGTAPITPHEIVSTCMQMHLGGHSTTTNQLANGLVLLGKHPDAYAEIKADLSLVPGAVEEILRYESPARCTIHRVAPHDIELGDYTIPEGAVAYAMLGAVNRDPEVFEDPHVFNIRRENNRHLAFSGGPRFCAGAAIARMELQETFRVLIDEYPKLDFDVDSLKWRDSFVFRHVESLVVRWSDR